MARTSKKISTSPLIHVRRVLPKPSIVYDTYWRFAYERQNIFFRRLKGVVSPWTSDPILKLHKFTNAYRAADRVSQFLIRSVIYNGPQKSEDIFFRILLFKIFNKIETWQFLENKFGELSLKNFKIGAFEKFLGNLKAETSIYSAAYIMPSGGKNSPFSQKHQMHLHLLKKMLDDKLPLKIERACNMEEAFKLLREYPTMGDFLAYQFITDLNYSSLTNFSEMEFVMPGPGAKDGLRKCFANFGDYTESEVIRHVTESQDSEFDRLGLKFQNLWGRPLQLIDCQNIFCETDKYSRVAHPEFKGRSDRTRIKQKFTSHGQLQKPYFPPKWGLKISPRDQVNTIRTNESEISM